MKHIGKFIITALTALVIFSGCAHIDEIKKDTVNDDVKELMKNNSEDLNALAPIVKIPINRKKNYFMVQEPNIYKTNKQISIEFDKHPVPFKTIIKTIANQLNANIIFSYAERKDQTETLTQQFTRQPATTTNLATQTATTTANTNNIERVEYFDRLISLKYKGGIKELFDYLAETTGYFFIFQGNNLIVKERETFKIMIPNYPGIIKEVNTSLEKLGASDVAIDEVTNNITFTANYRTYRRIVDYANDIRNNLAMIKLRIIVMDVSLTGSNNMGIDWSQIVLGFKSQMQTAANNNFGIPSITSNSSTSTTTSNSTTATTNTTSSNIFAEGVGAVTSGTGTQLYIQGAKFTLAAFANMIQSYGKTRVLQNLNLETMSGKKGFLSTVVLTPYIKNVGVNALNSNSTTNAAETGYAKDGTELEYTPKYSKDEGTLTIDLSLGIYNTGKFIQLSAGTLGTLSIPVETNKKCIVITRMAPGQLSIIGGLTFEQKIDNGSGLGVDTYLTDATNKTISKEEIVIIVKPQIYQFEPVDM